MDEGGLEQAQAWRRVPSHPEVRVLKAGTQYYDNISDFGNEDNNDDEDNYGEEDDEDDDDGEEEEGEEEETPG
jgi:hypothetical protein